MTVAFSNTMPTRSLRVLIVEDEQRLRDLLLEALPDMGYSASAVRSGEEALRLMQQQPHDVMLLDLHLPAMDGMDLFTQIRTRWPATQVIIMTGYGDLETARRAIHLDVVEFLSKPSPLSEIEKALERARQRVHGADRQQIAVPERHETVSASGNSVTMWEAQRRQILEALERNAGNRTAAAEELGISRRTLHYRINAYREQGCWPEEM
jgi:DNA-binding NtrC family response regulator